jgi:hypothetical protein
VDQDRDGDEPETHRKEDGVEDGHGAGGNRQEAMGNGLELRMAPVWYAVGVGLASKGGAWRAPSSHCLLPIAHCPFTLTCSA